MSHFLQVYEYQRLKVDKTHFTDAHFQQLAEYKTKASHCPYFDIFHKEIRFCNYVGVIKIGDLTIEVLPKVDKYSLNREEADKSLWQAVLIKMLWTALGVEAQATTHAELNLQRHRVLDAYLQLFLQEVRGLCRAGLIKQYRRQQGNQLALRGRLVIAQHIAQNSTHAERFYTEHSVYDRDNRYNRILYKALLVVQKISRQSSWSNACGALLLDFPECSDIAIDETLFERLRYDRKTARYRTAIELARIILLQYHPDVSGGNASILAIMFDMNLLWERYIYAMLRRADCRVDAQTNKRFWRQWNSRQTASLRPDLVVEKAGQRFVLDTKWKYQSDVSMQDLRQMYAYSHYFNARQVYLVYPDPSIGDCPVRIEAGAFSDPQNSRLDSDRFCGLLFVDILSNDRRLNYAIGKEMLAQIEITPTNPLP